MCDEGHAGRILVLILSLCTHQPDGLGNFATLTTCIEAAVGVSGVCASIPCGASPLKALVVDN